jgi:hypothetical protein
MRYDEQVDALYLSLDESDVVESEEVKPGSFWTSMPPARSSASKCST